MIPYMDNLKTFCGFSMGTNQYWAWIVYDLYVYFMTGTPKGSTKSGFMEKPGIEPATPGLQDIGLSPLYLLYIDTLKAVLKEIVI